MMKSKWLVTSCIALLLIANGFAQNGASSLLHAVYNNLQKAKDYSVEANVKVDMPFIRILPINVKIYFKQKDKFKVESKSIAIVPRQGFDQASKILADSNSYTVVLQGYEQIGTVQSSIVNVIPLADSSDLVLAKFWIDPVKSVILKSQFTTKSSGTIATEYTYGSQIQYGLPDKMVFSVDVKKFKMPKNFGGNLNKDEKSKGDKGNGNKKGKITIVLTGYQVNKGMLDSVFKK